MIRINETNELDLKNVMDLWNNGEVMSMVGFPEGLNITFDRIKNWYSHLQKNTQSKHFSIYDDDIYCGESFYGYDELNDISALDIKLHPIARGKGIAYRGLRHAINSLFANTSASKCYVDPNEKNTKAWILYEKLGFESKPRPSFLEPSSTYLELTREKWDTPFLELLSVNDAYLVYEMLQEIPAVENGFHNKFNEMSYQDFKKSLVRWVEISQETKTTLTFVPQSIYWLKAQGEYMGFAKLRHSLNEGLRECGGHIGYAIKLSKRNLGYGTKMLSLVLKEAKKLSIETVLITVNLDNLPSIKITLNNGGKIVKTNDVYHFIEIKT